MSDEEGSVQTKIERPSQPRPGCLAPTWLREMKTSVAQAVSPVFDFTALGSQVLTKCCSVFFWCRGVLRPESVAGRDRFFFLPFVVTVSLFV